jgi:acyl carrier protein
LDTASRAQLTAFLRETLDRLGDSGELTDDGSLFLSGRLDSVAMLNVIMHLEHQFSMNFAEIDFDVELIDSINNMARLIDHR